MKLARVNVVRRSGDRPTTGHDLPAIDPAWAWSPYEPDSANPWNLQKAGHLYRRAAFGADWTELQTAVEQGPEKTIQRLLNGGLGQAAFEEQIKGMAEYVVADFIPTRMQALWLHRMLHTPYPLKERLTLFWHDHFATSNAKVQSVPYMLAQNDLLRQHALGGFRLMLQAISKDPAMMVWLDTNLSKKGTPNENYARELMELFSLGRGNYTEVDIREAAKAFTGWELQDGKYVFNEDQHDGGPKTVLGETGNWKGEDIVRICLNQDCCPYFLTRKLFQQFLSEAFEPSDRLMQPIAEQFRRSDYNIAGVVSTMLRSNLFFSEHAYRACVKSPTVFCVGIVRALEGRVGTVGLAQALDSLGQRLFYPPSVNGWDGGTAWLNSNTLLLRQNLALGLTSTEDDRFGRRTDPADIVRKYGKDSDDEVVDFFVKLFLQDDLPAESRSRLVEYMSKARSAPYPVYWSKQDVEDHRIRAVCHLVLTQPEFQLN